MNDWIDKLFIKRSDLFLKLLDQRWSRTEDLVNGMIRILSQHGITSGDLLDLCCGNGRVSIFMARNGFRATGIDISKAFLDDARKRATELNLSDRTTFLEGDVRNLKRVVRSTSRPFDIVINVWTSIGFYSYEEDLSIFKQARELSKETTILFIAETMHTEYLSIRFTPTSYSEFDDIVMLENRKYDPMTSQSSTSWIFYKKREKNLELIDSVEIQHHVYSLSELCSLLRKAGWQTVGYYGNLATLQSMSPLTSLNIVAKAR